MPNIKQMLEFVTKDPVAWAAFLAIPLVLICVACLMPRGKGKLLVNIERFLIILGVAAVFVVPFVLEKVKPDYLDFVPKTFFFENSFLVVTVVISLAAILIWGIFTGRSYVTQALYGMISCVALPFGLINLIFPEWAGANVMETFKTPSDLFRMLLYAACVFIPVWLIRSGEYKFRISSVWHLVSGFTVGGCVMTFMVETGFLGANSASVKRVLHLFDDVRSVEAIKDLPYALLGKIAALIGVFFLVIVVMGFLVSLANVILKTGDRMIVSESFGGFFFRTVGNVVANLVCGFGIIVVPQLINHTAEYPKALLYLVPVVLYFVIILVTSFLADTVEIKRGLKRAHKEYEAGLAA